VTEKKKKKHKKFKKKRRKKSREFVESVESFASSEEESESNWSLICSTEEDWEHLILKYKNSDQREDRKLFKLLNDCFLPEIKEMFVEKQREEKKKMQKQLSRRSSSRVEVLKKQQEEKDRQLALQLSKEAKKDSKIARDKRGRMRGRKRKITNSDVNDDEEDEEEGEDDDDDSGELQGDREERAKQREMMKEMRARREAERMVESQFRDEVLQQRARAKEKNETSNKRPTKKTEKEAITRKPRRPVRFETDSDDNDRSRKTVSELSSEGSSREHSPDGSEVDSDDIYKPPMEYKSSSAKTMFSNALIRAGTKSTKDSSLEREKQKSFKEILSDKPVVRKTPGLLLQTAGKGLLNKTKEVSKENGETEMILSRPSSGISFGLWGGHLPVEPSIISNSLSSSYDDKPLSVISNDKKDKSAKKVFSNWGGDFFKKNLDFRANTNRILEKLSKSGTSEINGSTNGSTNSDGLS